MADPSEYDHAPEKAREEGSEREWAQWLPHAADGERVAPHTPRCMGCGPEARAGLRVEPWRRGEEVVATYVFGLDQEGAPGLAHGGAVAALCDDLLGHVLTGSGIAAVTRHLEIDYHRPVLLGEAHEVVSRLESAEGRKVWIAAEGVGPDGARRFTARGLFIKVGVEHFLAGVSAQERDRAKGNIAELREEGKDVAAW